MANYYTEHPEIEFHLNHPLMKRIVDLKERNYADKDKFEEAPVNYEDAIENYKRILDITGEVAGDTLAPNSEAVDLEGPHLIDNRMHYASKTLENFEATRKAGLWGVSMPRRYGGLNLPNVVFSMMSEMISAGDGGFQNLWSLQSCIDTLYEFGSEEQRQKYIPRICAGETMSMDLTEPDAGSDLQRVMLKASFDEKEKCWRLNGVKRFITNGDSDIHLVLARSEEGTKDGRGLSMFIYDKREGGVDVRHIEHKLGIHGSPTCELVYKNAKAELCGSTRMGLIKYVMALMNGARLGIAAQSVGVSQEAYNEALAYAKDRAQFGKKIINMPPVYDMLSRMKAKLDAGRSLLYQTARYVDIYKATTQLQVVAAIRYITNGTYLSIIREMLEEEVSVEMEPLRKLIATLVEDYEAAVNKVKENENQDVQDFLARRLYDMTTEIIMSLLIIADASKAPELFAKSAHVFVKMTEENVIGKVAYINNFDVSDLPSFEQ